MQFRVKGLEDFEDNEDWGDLFFEAKIQFRPVSHELAAVYQEAGLDNTFWLCLSPEYGPGAFCGEVISRQVVEIKLIPLLEAGLKKVHLSEKAGYYGDFYPKTLEAILRVAKTCVRLQRDLQLAGF